MNQPNDHHYLTTHPSQDLARRFPCSVLSDAAIDNADRGEVALFRKLIEAALLARAQGGGAA